MCPPALRHALALCRASTSDLSKGVDGRNKSGHGANLFRSLFMIFSRDRILTTHVGSLPRNEKLSDLLVAQEEGKDYDPKLMAAEMDAAVRHVVKKQMDAGIDIGNDGEQRRIGFQTYVPQRMTGFGGV